MQIILPQITDRYKLPLYINRINCFSFNPLYEYGNIAAIYNERTLNDNKMILIKIPHNCKLQLCGILFLNRITRTALIHYGFSFGLLKEA